MVSTDAPEVAPWSPQLRKLKLFTVLYVVLLIIIFSLMPVGKNVKVLIGLLTLAALACYIAALVYAYMTQKRMNNAMVYSPGAWQVIVAGIILNPALGWIIFWSVIRKAGKLEREWLFNSSASNV